MSTRSIAILSVVVNEMHGMDMPTPFVTVPEALEEFSRGRIVVVVDDEDRENEGDLTLAAEFVTPDAINFMAKHGRGLICLTLTEERADHMHLSPMTQANTSLWHRFYGKHRSKRWRNNGHLRV